MTILKKGSTVLCFLTFASITKADDRPHKEVLRVDVTPQYFLKHAHAVVPRYAELPHQAAASAPLRTHIREHTENVHQNARKASGPTGVIVAPIPATADADAQHDDYNTEPSREDDLPVEQDIAVSSHPIGGHQAVDDDDDDGHINNDANNAAPQQNSTAQTPRLDPVTPAAHPIGVPHTIQTLPRYEDDAEGAEYSAHLKKVFRESNREFVIEKENLEDRIEHLEHKLHHLQGKAPHAAHKSETEDESSGESNSNFDDEHVSRIPERKGDQVGKVVSHLILGGIIFATIFFFMSQYSAGTKAMTMQIIDMVTAIFLAISWFQGFDDLLHLYRFEENHVVLAGLCHALFLFTLVCLVAWSLRKEGERTMPVFAACGAHYVSFSIIHVTGKTQEAFFDTSEILCFASVLVIMCIFLGLVVVFHQLRKRASETDKEWVEVVEDVENDLTAMGVAFAFTMAVRYLVCGRYPPLEDGEGHEIHHDANQRSMFLVYTVGISMLSFWLIPWLDGEASRSTYQVPRMDPTTSERRWRWFTLRLLKLAATTLGMMTAWAIFLWADWQFFEVFYHGEKIYGRLVFASWATAVSLMIFFLVDTFGKPILGMSRTLFLTVFAIVIAFAWEEVLDQALETAVEGRRHTVGVKMGAAIVIAVVVFPVYVWYLKPAVERAVKQI